MSQNNQEQSRETIRTNFFEIQQNLFKKDITYYEFLSELTESKLVEDLQDILSYKKALPKLKELSDLVTFLRFIKRLIQMIRQIQKSSSDSSQRNQNLLKDTLIGFLQLQELEFEITFKLRYSLGLSSVKAQQWINNPKWCELIELLKDDILPFLSEEKISAFQEVYQLLDIPNGLDFNRIDNLIQIFQDQDDLKQFLNELDQTKKQLEEVQPTNIDQTEKILFLVDIMIEVQKKIQDDLYQKKKIDLIEQCIFKCLQKEPIYKYVSTFFEQIQHEADQNCKFLECLKNIVQYSPKKQNEEVFNKYKLIYYNLSKKKNQEQPEQRENRFDPELIQTIEWELNLINELPVHQQKVDFETNIIPDEYECRNVSDYTQFLKRINTRRPYRDQKEYLQNMFDFLRADSHQQLAVGMNSAIEIARGINLGNVVDFKSLQKEINPLKQLNPQFNFYNNIEIIKISFEKGLAITLSIQPILPKRNMKLNLLYSKRLLGDQYVYLTDYNFTRIYPCQLENEVINESVKQLNLEYCSLRIKIRLVDQKQNIGEFIEDIKESIISNIALIIEPKIYLGQHISCMNAIKYMINNSFNIPFKDNLLYLEKKIQMPTFINENTSYYLDFTPLNQDPTQDVLDAQQNTKYQQRLLGDWSSIPTLKYLNESQAKALKNILTKQISLIQGPPGTGKTYVGAMAVRNILENSDVWNQNKKLILMVCKTNHALDQFLSHIIKFEKEVIRVGARSKLQEMKQYQLHNFRKQYSLQSSSFFSNQNMEKKLNKSLKFFSDKLFKARDCVELIKFLPQNLVKQCCKMFLMNFQYSLPFLRSSMNDILKDSSFYIIIVQFWWRLNPNIYDMKHKLFYPLIQKYYKEEDGKDSAFKKSELIKYLEYDLYKYHKMNFDNFHNLYKQKLNEKINGTNYFYEKSQDDKLEGKMQAEEFQIQNEKIQALWAKIIKYRDTDKVQEYQDGEVIDEFEYAEDREDYEIYEGDKDDLNSSMMSQSSQSSQSSQQKQFKNLSCSKKSEKQKKEKDLLYLTYFQFLFQQQEDKYQELKKLIESKKIESLSPYDEIIIRVQAISKYSQKNNNILFKREDLKEYEKVKEKQNIEQINQDIKIMQKKKIVAMTLGGICKYSEYLQYLKYDILIIEEAAEVLENLTVPLLQNFLKQIILIGDHKQLKPTVHSYLMESKFNMNVSLFQRLVENNLEYVCLNEQMRMSPEFSDYVRVIYNQKDQYIDSNKVLEYKREVVGLPNNIMFFMHSFQEMSLQYTTTKKNEKEAQLAVELAKYICQQKQYKPEQITILAMYQGQAILVKQLINRCQEIQNIVVRTLDNYQGEENEIVILSLVRSDPNNLGFVKIQNRINVSISRAKRGFIILGNKALRKTQNPVWQKIFAKANKNQHIYEDKFQVECPQHKKLLTFSDPQSFNRLPNGPNGGCNKNCSLQNLSCGHTCELKCHAGKCDNYNCNKAVEFQFQICKHKTIIKCYELKNQELLQCQQQIAFKNDKCQHEKSIECYKVDYIPLSDLEENDQGYDKEQIEGDYQKAIKPEFEKSFEEKICKSKCLKKLPCLHECQQDCHVELKYCLNKCTVILNKKLECGHMFNKQCGDFQDYKCQEKINKKLNCNQVHTIECCQQNSLECKEVHQVNQQKQQLSKKLKQDKLDLENPEAFPALLDSIN